MICPVCSVEAPNGDHFCESCGTRLGGAEGEHQAPAQESICNCGAPPDDVDEDGFCLGCGRRVRRPASDHVEQQLSACCAAVSDRGLRHAKNEDRFALVQANQATALIVCDGVSATRDAEAASQFTAETIAAWLSEHMVQEESQSPEEILLQAIATAQEGCQNLQSVHDETPPSTTVVAAIVSGEEITVAWLGDSRAYWVTSEGARALTRDHSWAEEALASGEWTEAEVAASPHAHAITRWIGADAEASFQADVAHCAVEEEGALLLCSDGFWNYLPQPEPLHAVVWASLQKNNDLLQVARELVSYANEQGGQDNITVALWRIEPHASPEPV